jgi:hypothetical protein
MLARNPQPELMDNPDIDPRAHRQALRGLSRINQFSRTVVPRGPSEDSAAWRRVTLAARGVSAQQVSARVVLVADGLGHPSLDRLPEFSARIESNARIGLGATLPAGE